MKFLKIYLIKIKIDFEIVYIAEYHIYSNQNHHKNIRKEVYEYLAKNKNKYLSHFITDNIKIKNDSDFESLIIREK